MKKIIVILTLLVSITAFAGGDKELLKEIENYKAQIANLNDEIEKLHLEVEKCKELTKISNYFSDTTLAVFNCEELLPLESQFTSEQNEKFVTFRKITEARKSLDEIQMNINNLTEENKDQIVESDLNILIGIKIKKEMQNLANQLDKIDKFDMTFMSPEQVKYVKQLFKDYDTIFNKYY